MEDARLDNIIRRIQDNQPEHFCMNDEDLSREQVIRLCDALKDNTSINELELVHCNINIEGASLLADNTSIERLILTRNNIWFLGSLALGLNQTIKYLDLRDNKISVTGALALVPNTTLQVILLDGNYLDNSDRQRVKHAFKKKGMLSPNGEMNFYREK